MSLSLFSEPTVIISKPSHTLGVIDQIEIATSKGNMKSLLLGFFVGGLIPAGTFYLVHFELLTHLWLIPIILFGLLKSSTTVYKWLMIFYKGNKAEAIGSVVLMEAIMSVCSNFYFAVPFLLILVFINGMAGSCNLVLDKKETKANRRNAQAPRPARVTKKATKRRSLSVAA